MRATDAPRDATPREHADRGEDAEREPNALAVGRDDARRAAPRGDDPASSSRRGASSPPSITARDAIGRGGLRTVRRRRGRE
jgi:hypothetical protein